MKSWTRTLNLHDAHTLLALVVPGTPFETWAERCHAFLPGLSMARRRELVRMLRDGFLVLDDDGLITDARFLHTYQHAPAAAQIDLVHAQWALTHPLSRIAAERLVAPALEVGELDIPLDDVEALVAEHISTRSAESRRKTRTVLLGALEGIGVLETSGTGQHRALRASRGRPHPVTYGYLLAKELDDRGATRMGATEATTSSLAARLTQCGPEHAAWCLDDNLARGAFASDGDDIRLAQEA